MFVLAGEFILIVAYMRENMWMGLAAWLALMLKQMPGKRDSVDFCMRLMILSLPISYLEVTCQMGSHIFKWYNFAALGLAVALLFKIFRKKIIKKDIFAILLFVLIVQLCRGLFTEDISSTIREFIQEMLTVSIVGLFCVYIDGLKRTNNLSQVTNLCSPEWTKLYLQAVLASALATLYQYYIYITRHEVIGNATLWATRPVFDMTFTGYSVLSIYLAGGLVLLAPRLISLSRGGGGSKLSAIHGYSFRMCDQYFSKWAFCRNSNYFSDDSSAFP